MILPLYAATAAVFLVLDAIMRTLVMKPLFAPHIGPLLAGPIRLAPPRCSAWLTLQALCTSSPFPPSAPARRT